MLPSQKKLKSNKKQKKSYFEKKKSMWKRAAGVLGCAAMAAGTDAKLKQSLLDHLKGPPHNLENLAAIANVILDTTVNAVFFVV